MGSVPTAATDSDRAHPPWGEGDATVTGDRRWSAALGIARILVTEDDPETMADRFLSSLAHSLPAVDAGILLLSDSATSGRLKVRAASGYLLAVLGQLDLGPEDGPFGQVLLTDQAALYPDPDAVGACVVSVGAQELLQALAHFFGQDILLDLST